MMITSAAGVMLVAAAAYWLIGCGPHLTPVLDAEAAPGQPVLLAKGFVSTTGVDKLPPTRSADSSGRALQSNGIVTSVEKGAATINLGSLDGLAAGSEVPVFSNEQSTEAAGRLTVTEVFRERAHGQLTGEVKVNYTARVSGVEFLHAMLAQVDAAALRDDLAGARELAEKAIIWADSSKLAAGERRRAVRSEE